LDQEQQPKSEENPRETPKESPPVDANAPYVLIASVLIGSAIGYALDDHYDSSPAWTIGMFFVFMAIGFYHLVKNVWRP
jgi:F0F1-type ATP synthase assembly protein I